MTALRRALGITGACGYIGTRLVARLAQSDDFERIVCVDVREPGEVLPARFEFHRCDVRDGMGLRRILEDTGVDTVIHLAFIADPTRDPGFEYDVDVNGSRNVLEACAALGVSKLVVVSSDVVYGFFEGTPDHLSEDAPLRETPGFPYAENKVKGEALVAEFAVRVPACAVVVLRPCIVMGPHMDNTTGNSLLQPVLFAVRGYDPLMQFIHEEDAAEVFYLASTRDVRGVFNVAADEGLRYSELARMAGKPLVALPAGLMYPLIEVLYRLRLMGFGAAQLGYIRYPLSMNAARIQRELGFVPRYASRQTVEAFLAARGGG